MVEDAFLVPDEVPSSELPDVDVLAVRSEWKEWLLMGSSSRRLVSARRVFFILNVGAGLVTWRAIVVDGIRGQSFRPWANHLTPPANAAR